MFICMVYSIYGDIGDYDASRKSKDSSSKRDQHKSKDRSHDRYRTSERDEHKKSKSQQYFERLSHSEKEVSNTLTSPCGVMMPLSCQWLKGHFTVSLASWVLMQLFQREKQIVYFFACYCCITANFFNIHFHLPNRIAHCEYKILTAHHFFSPPQQLQYNEITLT